MADQKKEIKFNNSMNADKRNENFAYLRKGVFNSQTKGLYPAKDLTRAEPFLNPNDDLIAISGRQEDPWVFAEKSNGELVIYRLFDDDSDTISSGADGSNINAIAHGVDGTYWVDESADQVWTIYDSNDDANKVADFPSSPSVSIGVWDGLYYWWIGGKIWRQLPDENPELMMTSTGFNRLRFVVPYKDTLVAFDQGTKNQFRIMQDLTVYFYDKANTTLFAKRITMKSCVILGAGVLNEQLTIAYFQQNASNGHENMGEMVIAAWNGEKFQRINSIPMFRSVIVPYEDNMGQSCDYNNEYMIFAVDNNDRTQMNQDLAKNFIYKVYADGRIEVLAEPIQNGTINYAKIVRVDKDFNLYAMDSQGIESPKIYLDGNTWDTYDEYYNFTQTEYITNFYCNPANRHKLTGLSVTFEKMFNNNSGSRSPYLTDQFLYPSGTIDTKSTIYWYPANDAHTPENELEYAVYISNINNISNVSEIELNGTLVSNYSNKNFYEITDLEPETTYWVNVIVKDNAGKKTPYSQTSFTTRELGTLASEWKLGTSVGTVSGSSNFSDPARVNSYTDNYASGRDSAKMTTYGFGHSIPSGATILGIEVRTKSYSPFNEQIPDPSPIFRVFKNASSSISYPSGGSYYAETGNRTTGLITSRTSLFSNTWSVSDLTDIGVLIEGNASATPNSIYYNVSYVEMRIIYKP